MFRLSQSNSGGPPCFSVQSDKAVPASKVHLMNSLEKSRCKTGIMRARNELGSGKQFVLGYLRLYKTGSAALTTFELILSHFDLKLSANGRRNSALVFFLMKSDLLSNCKSK